MNKIINFFKNNKAKIIPLIILILVSLIYQATFVNRVIPPQSGWWQYYGWRVVEGDLLYKDIYCFLQPYFVWFLAILFKLFGNQMGVYLVIGVILREISIVLIYLILVRFIKPLGAFLASFFGLVIQSSYLMDMPFDYNPIIFVLVVVVCYLSVLYFESKNKKYKMIYMILIGFFSGIHFMMKQSSGIIVPVCGILLYVLLCFNQNKMKEIFPIILFFGVGFLIASLPGYLYLLITDTFKDYLICVLGTATVKGNMFSIIERFFVYMFNVYDFYIAVFLILGIFIRVMLLKHKNVSLDSVLIYDGKNFKNGYLLDMALVMVFCVINITAIIMCANLPTNGVININVIMTMLLFGATLLLLIVFLKAREALLPNATFLSNTSFLLCLILFILRFKDHISLLLLSLDSYVLIMLGLGIVIFALILINFNKVKSNFGRNYIIVTLSILICILLVLSLSMEQLKQIYKEGQVFDFKRIFVWIFYYAGVLYFAIESISIIFRKKLFISMPIYILSAFSFFLVTCSLAGSIVEEFLMMMNVALIIGVIFEYISSKESIKKGMIYSVLYLVMFMAVIQKQVVPYSWHTWQTQAPDDEDNQLVYSSIEGLEGYRLTKYEEESYQAIIDIILQNSTEDDTVYQFSNITLFNVLTKRKTPTYSPVNYFDVCPDEIASNDAKILQENPPKIVIWGYLDEWNWNFHESYFRNGKRSGQRDIKDFYEKYVVNSGNYTCYGVFYSSVGSIYVWVRN